MLKNSARMFNVPQQNKCRRTVSRIHVKSPSFARCKEGALTLLNFSKLTCMCILYSIYCGSNVLPIKAIMSRTFILLERAVPIDLHFVLGQRSKVRFERSGSDVKGQGHSG